MPLHNTTISPYTQHQPFQSRTPHTHHLIPPPTHTHTHTHTQQTENHPDAVGFVFRHSQVRRREVQRRRAAADVYRLQDMSRGQVRGGNRPQDGNVLGPLRCRPLLLGGQRRQTAAQVPGGQVRCGGRARQQRLRRLVPDRVLVSHSDYLCDRAHVQGRLLRRLRGAVGKHVHRAVSGGILLPEWHQHGNGTSMHRHQDALSPRVDRSVLHRLWLLQHRRTAPHLVSLVCCGNDTVVFRLFPPHRHV